MQAVRPRRIVIIGGGFAGAVTAIRLLDQADVPLAITIIERRAELGRGVAYSTTELVHLLNGTAQTSTLHPSDPGHLARWLAENGEAAGWTPPADILASSPPRWLYGSYVGSELGRAIHDASGRATLTHLKVDAVAVFLESHGFRIHLAGGEAIAADLVVLALGVFAGALAPAESALSGDPRYVPVPWQAEALDRLAGARRLLLIGSSLSMVDVVASMEARGFRGDYRIVSRRGQLVEGRHAVEPWRDFLAEEPLPRTARELLRRVRAERAAIAEAGEDWQRLPFPIRAHVAALWQAADTRERARFARHLRAFWDVSLHRAAPASYVAVDAARSEGRLHVAAGRVTSLAAEDGGIRARIRSRTTGQEGEALFDGVVNCRGHQEHDWRRIAAPLVQQLLEGGLVVPHATGFGIDATPGGAVIDARGRSSGRLFAIGHPLRGVSWESSAIGEQLAQATALAPQLLKASLDARVAESV